MIEKVWDKPEATVWDRGIMYKAVAQSVLLYDRESWVGLGEMLKVMEGFHHWAARHILRMTVTRGEGGELKYSPVVAAKEATGIHPIMEYIRRRQATIATKVE